MFHRIVIPLDADPTTEAAVGAARSLAQRLGAELIELPCGGDDVSERAMAAAEEERADLLVLPTGSCAGDDGRACGATLARALSSATTPVLVISHAPSDVMFPEPLAASTSLVIAPLDGTAVAERALPYAIALASQLDRVLLLAHVVPACLRLDDPGRSTAWAEASRDGRRYLRAVRQRIAAQTAVSVETMQLHGDVGQALARLVQAHEGSLLVFQAHDERVLDGVLHTTVTKDLLQRAPSPLLVIPSASQRILTREDVVAAPTWRR